MFKKNIKEKYDGCNTRELFLNIRRELKDGSKYGNGDGKELESLKKKINVFDRMILGTSKDKYIDYGNFILTRDRFDIKEHYLLIPKDISYFNVLTLEKKDIPMLEDMKKLVKRILNEKILYFHCYPFNSVHTLHLHVVDEKDYVPRKNNLMIDDVIYVLKNENVMNLEIENRLQQFEEIVKDWFKTRELSLLNIYTLALIIIEQSGAKDKKKIIPYAVDFILDFFQEKDTILKYFLEEKESLDSIGEMLLYVSKNPNLLQK